MEYPIKKKIIFVGYDHVKVSAWKGYGKIGTYPQTAIIFLEKPEENKIIEGYEWLNLYEKLLLHIDEIEDNGFIRMSKV